MADIVRQALVELKIGEMLSRENAIDRMIAYFDRRDDHGQIRSATDSRYGTGIKLVRDPNNSSAVIETFSKTDFAFKIDNGMIEAISLGFGNKMADALATLFSEQGQKYTLTHDSVEDTSEAEELLNRHRSGGGYRSVMVDADRKSVLCGSAVIFSSFVDGGMSYQLFSPGRVRAYFSDYVESNGERRPVDESDIDDATAIVIRLNQVDVDLWNYLAIFGRSDVEGYDRGRHVLYQASSSSTKIPDFYQDGAIEYDGIDGKPCNPLSWLAIQYPDMNIPEYPITVIYGGVTSDGTILPVTTSLYDDCLEIDTMVSRLLSCSGDAARGTNIYERDEQGAGKPLPRTTVGDVVLEMGIHFRHESLEPTAAQIGFEVLKDIMIHMASGYGVPDYMVVSQDMSLDASSGIALQVKTRQLKKNRERRIEQNSPRVNRLFKVEKALIHLFDEPGAENDLLFNCSQTWDAGELKLPENKKEAADRIIALMDKGILDTVAAIREYHQCTTDAEAMEIYDRMRDRQSEYPSLAPQQKRQLGLIPRV
jgi:hypothetical protein